MIFRLFLTARYLIAINCYYYASSKVHKVTKENERLEFKQLILAYLPDLLKLEYSATFTLCTCYACKTTSSSKHVFFLGSTWTLVEQISFVFSLVLGPVDNNMQNISLYTRPCSPTLTFFSAVNFSPMFQLTRSL